MLKNQRGQALLIVIVALTISLAVITSVSLRNISSISRIASTDTSTRVSAAAEGGAERFLNLPASTLESLRTCTVGSSCQGACTGIGADIQYYNGDSTKYPRGACQVNFNPTSGDNVTSRAYVTVGANTATEYEFNLDRDQMFEVNMNGIIGSGISTFITLCWKGDTTHLYYTGYSSTTHQKGFLCNNSGCPLSAVFGRSQTITTNTPTNSACPSSEGFTNEVALNRGVHIPTGPLGVRIRAISGDTTVKVVANTAGGISLPLQAYIIRSVGELSQSTTVTATRSVEVKKSLPFLPPQFDFGIYTGSSLP